MSKGLILVFAAWLTVGGSLANRIPEQQEYHYHYEHYDEGKSSEDDHRKILPLNEHHSSVGSHQKAAMEENLKPKSDHKILHEGQDEEDYYDFSGASYDRVHGFEEHDDYPVGENEEDEQPVSDVHHQEAIPKHLVKDIAADTPAVSFSAEKNFRGAELFFDGHSLSLPKPVKSKSHRLKGGFNWTIYPKGNYSGPPTCLMTDPGHLHTSGHMDLIIGSVRRGCWCNDTMTVTPKPRSRVPGVQLWSGRNGEGESAYTDGSETRFPHAIEMNSFQLIGTWVPWTLFAASNFTGESNCLVAAPASPKGGVNYYFTNIPKQLIVGSVQKGCVASTSFKFAGIDEETVKKDKAGAAAGKPAMENDVEKISVDKDGDADEENKVEGGYDSAGEDVIDTGENGKAESDAKKANGVEPLKISGFQLSILSIGSVLVIAATQ